MATKQVNIDIIAKDKTRQAMKSATTGVDKLKQSVFNLRNALVGLGAGVAIKSFVDVGRQVESLQIRLKFLFGSVEEGAKAFDVMSKFASKVPFSLEEIQRGAGSLAVVSKDADELSKILAITGNVATIAGVDFQTASEQIQRALTAGIASAEIFKERGVRDLLGFKAGATVTAEETAEAFERVFGKGGRFAGATDDLAITLSGTLSMLGDKLFQFQKVVAEQFLIGLKQEFGALDKALQDNEETIDKVAKAIGKGLSTAVIAVGKGFKFLAENFETIKAIGMGLVVAKITTSFFDIYEQMLDDLYDHFEAWKAWVGWNKFIKTYHMQEVDGRESYKYDEPAKLSYIKRGLDDLSKHVELAKTNKYYNDSEFVNEMVSNVEKGINDVRGLIDKYEQ